jgi:hypothetical protein
MSPAADHPIFITPPDPNVKIWRYMDFTKYVSMLVSGGLYFSRSDLLGDPFEASSSQANIALRPKVYEDLIEEVKGAGVMTLISTFITLPMRITLKRGSRTSSPSVARATITSTLGPKLRGRTKG